MFARLHDTLRLVIECSLKVSYPHSSSPVCYVLMAIVLLINPACLFCTQK